jgi:hypothetical protein
MSVWRNRMSWTPSFENLSRNASATSRPERTRLRRSACVSKMTIFVVRRRHRSCAARVNSSSACWWLTSSRASRVKNPPESTKTRLTERVSLRICRRGVCTCSQTRRGMRRAQYQTGTTIPNRVLAGSARLACSRCEEVCERAMHPPCWQGLPSVRFRHYSIYHSMEIDDGRVG